MSPAPSDLLEAPPVAAADAHRTAAPVADDDPPFLDAALAEDYAADAGLPLRHAFTWQHLNRGRHAEIALHDGRMRCIDPWTGEWLVSTAAFAVPGDWLSIVYRFAGRERFDLVTSSFDQAKIGLWFPERQLFAAGRVERNWIALGTEAVLALQASEAEASVRPPPPDGVPTSVLHLGFSRNLGHYLWNDLSGLESVIDSVGATAIGAVVCGPHDFFPVDALFPELAEAGVHVERWSRPLPRCVAYPHHLPLRVPGNRLSRALRRRIVAWAIAEEREQLASAAAINTGGVNVWFNLRLHNKSWVDQVAHIVMLARTFQDVMPATQRLTLLLDGTPDTSPLVRRIAAELQGSADVVDATAVPLSRSVLLAGLIDLHVCVVGSGLTLPHWIMGRRGIAHSNRPHLVQQRFWNNVAEGAHDVSFLPASAITDLDGPRVPDATYVNYRIDPLVMIDRLDALWRQMDANLRRSGFDQMLRLAAAGDFGAAADRLLGV